MPGDKDFNELITSFRLLKMIAVLAKQLGKYRYFLGGGSEYDERGKLSEQIK